MSWQIAAGHANNLDLSGLKIALAGFYVDAVPGKPWSVCIYIDDTATAAQFEALRTIYAGKAGGNMMFTGEFGVIFDVKLARIVLEHARGSESIKVSEQASASVVRQVEANGTVTCAIPGHDHPGQEYVCNLAVSDGPLKWRHHERCGFATDFAYSN